MKMFQPEPCSVKNTDHHNSLYSQISTATSNLSGCSDWPLDKELDAKNRNAKAAKKDDVPIPEYLWDEAIVKDGDQLKIQALSVIRTFALRWWKRHTMRDFLNWLSQTRSMPSQRNRWRRT
jgi:hypothetical protein